MKVVHLNAYDGNGGAGRACMRLGAALRQQGVDAEVWVNYAFGQHQHTRAFPADFIQKGATALRIKAEQAITKTQLKALRVPFSLPIFGRDLMKHPAVLHADILHLHWINHAFLTPENIAQLASLKKPLVWTFHDSNAFTGGCHVRYACDHFERQCGHCPVLKKPGPDDLSHRIWRRKSDAYQQAALHIIAPSSWMAASVKRSGMLAGQPVHIIPNTLETDVFRPDAGRGENGRFRLLSGFMPSRLDAHKGTSYLFEALELFSKMPGVDPARVDVQVFGNRGKVEIASPFPLTFSGVIRDDKKLAEVYGGADVFLAPSLEDNLPYTVMESLACGTPVVAFTTGGIPDMVGHQQNGYLAGYRSAEDFARGIYWIYQHNMRISLRQNARESIMTNFSEPVIAEKHIRLYESLLHE